MVRLEEDGVEFYDDTNGVPQHGYAPHGVRDAYPPTRATPPNQHGGGSGALDGDGPGMPAGFEGMEPWQIHDFMQRQFFGVTSGFGRGTRSEQLGERGPTSGMFDDLFASALGTDPFSLNNGASWGSMIPENGNPGSVQTFSFSSKSYRGSDGCMYEEKRTRNANGEEEVQIREHDGTRGVERITTRGADGVERIEERSFGAPRADHRGQFMLEGQSEPASSQETDPPKRGLLSRLFSRR